jgi:hypothetical protein
MPILSQTRLRLAAILASTLLCCVLLASFVIAADKKDRYKIETKHIKLGMYPRTPAQMAGFYEGRGFPKRAIDETTRHCFITVGMRNLSKRKIWLDIDAWRFYNKHGEIKRTTRQQWEHTWQKLDVPMASQSTFNWTLLPEQRDLHPDEPVGGNITLQPVDEPFTVEATFATGEDRQGKPLVIRLENVRCLKNGEQLS